MVLVAEVLSYVWLLVVLVGGAGGGAATVYTTTHDTHDGSGAGGLGVLPPTLPDEEVTRGQVLPRPSRPHLDLPRPPATPRGLHDAPGTSRAGDQERGQLERQRKRETQTTVTKNNEHDAFTPPQYARSKRKTRDLLPLPGHLGDLEGEGREDDLLLLPLPYSSKWSRVEEKRNRNGRGRRHRRRHRVRHGKRRREKENSELLLLDTDLSFGSVLQEAQGKRTLEGADAPQGAHHTPQVPTPHLNEAPSYLSPLDDKATTENMAEPNQPSKFRARVVEGPHKAKEPSMPTISDPSTPQTVPPPTSWADGVLTTAYHPSNDSQDAAPTTHHSVVSSLTSEGGHQHHPTAGASEGSSTLRTPTDHGGDSKMVVNSSVMQGDEVTTAAEGLHQQHTAALAGNLGPNVTEKPQDSRRDPSESNKRQAIKLGSGPRHPSQMNPATTLKNSEHYADLKLMMGPLTANHSHEQQQYDNSIAQSLLALSATQLEDDGASDAHGGQKERDEGGEAPRVVGSGPPLHPLPHVSPGAAFTDLRSGRGGAAAGTGGASSQLPATADDVPGEDSTEGSTEDSSEDSSEEVHTVVAATVYPSEGGHRRALVSTPASPSGCYSTNDLVVVVLLTSLVNLVAFVVVTLALCWCSLRGRLASPPLHPDDHNDHLDDDAAEEIAAPEGCLEACLPDISYQRHIARGSNLRPSFVVGRALRPLVHPHTPRLSHAVHELLHNLTGPAEDAHRREGVGEEEEEGGEQEKKTARKKKPGWLKRRSLSLENLTLT